jgi:mevalonate kinase
MGNIFNLAEEREKRKKEDPYYQTHIQRMSRIELLEEMVSFQEDRSTKQLTQLMTIRGIILFRALESKAETDELRILASSYRRHLENEVKTS